jgi:5-methylcytosine-specific restriction endonuclease McrA
MARTKKERIPKALREQVWRTICGDKFETKCNVTWCTNTINVFDFEVGHNVPESKGGALVLENLRPICSQCNRSMSNHYTIDEWNKLGGTTVVIAAKPLGPKKHVPISNVLANSVRPTAAAVPVVHTTSRWCC